MIVISQGNPFPADRARSGRVREIRDILAEVLATYDVASEEQAASARVEIISLPLESQAPPVHSGATTR